jgi:hypothetical protein
VGWVTVWETFPEFADVVLKMITEAGPPEEETPAGTESLSADPPREIEVPAEAVGSMGA